MNQEQIDDIRLLSDIYEISYINYWLSGIEIENIKAEDLNRWLEEDNKVEFGG